VEKVCPFVLTDSLRRNDPYPRWFIAGKILHHKPSRIDGADLEDPHQGCLHGFGCLGVRRLGGREDFLGRKGCVLVEAWLRELRNSRIAHIGRQREVGV